MSHHDELPSIDSAALDNVTGGVTVPAAATTRPPSGSQNAGPLQKPMPAMLMNGGKSAAGGACPCGCGMASCLPR